MLIEISKSSVARNHSCIRVVKTTDTEVFIQTESVVIVLDSARPITNIDDFFIKFFTSLEESFSAVYQLINTTSGGQFSLFCHLVKKNKIILVRDSTGCKSIYHSEIDDRYIVGSNPYDIATCTSAKLDQKSLEIFEKTGYLPKYKTFFSGVNELARGVIYDLKDDVVLIERPFCPSSVSHNSESYLTSIARYRDSVLSAHRRLASDDNVVFLSGGIDSCVMLAALKEVAGKSRLRAITFRAAGTIEDETPYAVEVARHLGIDCEVIEIDLSRPPAEGCLALHISRSALPYPGRLIYGQLPAEYKGATLFFGQDSRLHTPDVNMIDRFWFKYHSLVNNLGISKLTRKSKLRIGFKLRQENFSKLPRILRGFIRFFHGIKFYSYISRYFLNDSTFICNADLAGSRNIYNEIVRNKWDAQYVFDMRYLQDIGSTNGCFVALPFYDEENAKISAGLPWSSVVGNRLGFSGFGRSLSIVNKKLLRDAFSQELPPMIAGRKKAVSRTMSHIMNGFAGAEIKSKLNIKSEKVFQPEDESEAYKLFWQYIVEVIYKEGLDE